MVHGRDKKNQHDKLGFLAGGLDQGEDEQLLGVYDFCLNNYFFYPEHFSLDAKWMWGWQGRSSGEELVHLLVEKASLGCP